MPASILRRRHHAATAIVSSHFESVTSLAPSDSFDPESAVEKRRREFIAARNVLNLPNRHLFVLTLGLKLGTTVVSVMGLITFHISD